MLIRPAISDDIQSISALAVNTFTESFGHLYPAKDLAYHLEKSCSPRYFQGTMEIDSFFVAEDGHALVGYVKYGAVGLPVSVQQGDIELHRIYVLHAYQGKGIGTALMDTFLATAEARSARHIYVGVWENNTRAQNFYRSYGFERIGEYEYPVGEQVDKEWIMVRKNR